MFNPSRLAAAALLAALPTVGLAVAAAPAHAAPPVPVQQSDDGPSDGPEDGMFGGAGSLSGLPGMGDRFSRGAGNGGRVMDGLGNSSRLMGGLD
ncbi:hypothetical protein ABTY53_06295 [Streptomyces noursei]|uniref:hypothetical protein n=1 Tax=Streptomyces noursei TaxID=1971 RepID=UPI0033208DAE